MEQIISTFPTALEIIGLLAFSVSGVIIALQKHLDLMVLSLRSRLRAEAASCAISCSIKVSLLFLRTILISSRLQSQSSARLYSTKFIPAAILC